MIGAWFCPVVSRWFPPMIIEDMYRVGFFLRGLLLVASAVPLMRIIRRVSEWQLEPKQH